MGKVLLKDSIDLVVMCKFYQDLVIDLEHLAINCSNKFTDVVEVMIECVV